MNAELLKCKICGGELDIKPDQRICKCIYCGRTQTLPYNQDAQRIRLFNRGNRFRLKSDYDEAIRAFEDVIKMDDNDPEAHWCLALCRHGIEYVDSGGRKVPTCNRISYKTILEDVDYEDAIALSEGEARNIYKSSAQEIADIQTKIIQQSKGIEQSDIFICYKDKDENGDRTQDSIIAQDLYNQLIKENYRVFFSRVSLESKAGVEFEPYIFAALQSAKVMLVIGTKRSYMDAPWVKNEWSRYLTLVKERSNRLIIPCIKDMEADDLPSELSVLQYISMDKVGWLQDLLHVIHKNVSITADEKNTSNLENLAKRCELLIGDSEWDFARSYCNRVLDSDPQYGLAYYYLLLCDFKSSNERELSQHDNFQDNVNCRRAIQFGNDDVKKYISSASELLKQRHEFEQQAKKKQAEEARKTADLNRKKQLSRAQNLALSDCYLDRKRAAIIYCSLGFRKKAIQTFNFYDLIEDSISTMCPSKGVYNGIIYDYNGLLVTADGHAMIDGNLVDGATKVRKTEKANTTWLLYASGNVGNNAGGKYKNIKGANWENIIDIQKSSEMIIGLNREGDVVTSGGSILKRKKLSKWIGISQISASDTLILGCTSSGNVVALGENIYGQCNVDNWYDVIQVSAGCKHAVALKADGTVLATGINEQGQCNVENWKDILAVKAYPEETIGLQMDGTLVSTSTNNSAISKITNLFDLSEYDAYQKALDEEQNAIATGNSIATKLDALWEEKKKLKLWQMARRKEILEASNSLLEQLKSINSHLPEWYKLSVAENVEIWLGRNNVKERELSDYEVTNRIGNITAVGVIAGIIGGIIYIYYDTNGQGIFGQGISGGIAMLFVSAVVLGIAVMIGICAAFVVYCVIRIITSFIKEAKKL